MLFPLSSFFSFPLLSSPFLSTYPLVFSTSLFTIRLCSNFAIMRCWFCIICLACLLYGWKRIKSNSPLFSLSFQLTSNLVLQLLRADCNCKSSKKCISFLSLTYCAFFFKCKCNAIKYNASSSWSGKSYFFVTCFCVAVKAVKHFDFYRRHLMQFCLPDFEDKNIFWPIIFVSQTFTVCKSYFMCLCCSRTYFFWGNLKGF